MVLFNYSTKELTAKVVYYGPGLCGKTTNLQWTHEKLPIRNKGKMLSLATETDRTLFFDFLPIELGTIRGMKTRIQLYTVPGQVFYNATRRMVLKGADCVVFVCDSQEAMLDANLESLDNMRQNLEANEINPDEMPMVMQYNKRDLPNALPIEILNEKLNPRALPFYEAVAVKGIGVEETLKGVTGLVFRSLATKYGGLEAAAARAGGGAPAVVTAPVPRPAASAAPATTPPLRIVPPPRPAEPQRHAPAASPLPRLNVEAKPTADELLDSLELQPAADIDDLLPGPPEMDALLDSSNSDIEAVDLDYSFPPTAPSVAKEGRITLVSGPKEAERAPERTNRPALPDLNLDDLDSDEDIEELSFDPDTAPTRRPEPTPAIRVDTLPPGARAGSATRPAPKPTPAPAPRAPVPPPPTPAPSPAAVATTAPVSVQIPHAQGGMDVSIPVEITVGKDSAQVTIHLRLTLNLKLPQ